MYDYRPAEVPPALTRILTGLLPDDAERLVTAFRFAAAAHDGQTRDEGTPFIEHPLAVADILNEELGCDDVDVLVAALNHDVLEDCGWLGEEAVAAVLGARAMALVGYVTKEQAPECEKAARDRRYLDHLRTIPREAKLLKLADRIHNLRSIPAANDPAKARRYLDVSRDEFYPLALTVDPAAAVLVADACDAIEVYLAGIDVETPE
ncbi:MAG TPA: HD domain-containing protein [Thermomicrobiales bacterium]|nr:HD domain-containing protein [Thermomicrobiales bacterium]